MLVNRFTSVERRTRSRMTRRSRPTIVDVARTAGVSPTTVSYVLSGPRERAARISDETADRVREAVRELGYVPNLNARTLRLRQTNRVLFLGSRLNSLYSQEIAQSIERALMRHGLSMSVQIGSSAEHVQRAITALAQNLADGLILETGDGHLEALRQAAARRARHRRDRGRPALKQLLTSSPTTSLLPCDEAMSHLHDRGYAHYVLMSSFEQSEDDHRIQVALAQLRELGVSGSDITVLHCPHDRVAAHDAALGFLKNVPQPVAVYGGSDVSAIGVLWAARRLGMRVPGQVGIVGHGNTSETHITVPAITSLGPVSNDFSKAAGLIQSRLRDRSLPGRHIAEAYQLTVRQST